ncbi:type II toxin-antitoxin system RelE/ParE family toxin [Aulosira sp. FACHB-615]|uniref:type II toxin-antitoxin system RelE/ParE family toxin n=2 Tax=Nostocales TaxID=1161 RepID=UPI0016821268|nr:type II toxin-antitoxin system RelE/ParE family toxin [Aulosira sp. FACHB-615]MBD2487749.1 type II toxin-antitoxin system RelE/ParE family toxin [Aulosira sp. FACHB-615]
MSRYIIAPSAIRDLNDIANYFLDKNLEAGERIFREFHNKCQKLAQFPNMGRSYAHVKDSLRGLPLNGYIILYQVIDDGVTILRIVSGRQDLESLFAELDDN